MRFSKAMWRGEVPNRTPKGMDSEILGVVLHIMEGTLDGSDSWFKNPTAQASSHFGVGKDGRTYQWVDTQYAPTPTNETKLRPALFPNRPFSRKPRKGRSGMSGSHPTRREPSTLIS